MSASRRRPAGFTLIEVLIVVVILGILASMVIATFRNVRTEAEKNSFSSAGRKYVEAAQRYMYETDSYLEGAATGVLPSGFDPYIIESYWGLPTPVGGQWDTELNAFGVVSALGVHFNGVGETRDDAYMIDIDTALDDGNLSTGGFQKLAADRYYFVLVD